ncbi:uncharacterized protein BDW47DRAFT_109194 [Aspergillus candidus]|uniref:Uncharacterized protein n=1 Tax=Aspergillus candidus TaxID=41067 RepID=A0A2I2F6D9_ASPCN|nr:hypothetical protein BDW47DRAFT_109194 [Aspergillus candidus]PLB36148.1 hypothetical protein BDW47DRAFT_109194 [Aspergillus candidus]
MLQTPLHLFPRNPSRIVGLLVVGEGAAFGRLVRFQRRWRRRTRAAFTPALAFALGFLVFCPRSQIRYAGYNLVVFLESMVYGCQGA